MRLAIQGPASTGWETGRDNAFKIGTEWRRISVVSRTRGARSVSAYIYFSSETNNPIAGDIYDVCYPQLTVGDQPVPHVENDFTTTAIRTGCGFQGYMVGGMTNAVGTAAPTSGFCRVGDKVWNEAPTSGGTVGWVCTAQGSPGTWKTFGTIA